MFISQPIPILAALWRNKAPFLSLSLPGLATATLAPAIILVFTAETWDVGLGMTNTVAIVFTVSVIVLSTLYLTRIKTLFFPKKNKRIITEHLAVTNTMVFLSIFFALTGLFFIVLSLMLVIEFWLFPADLISTWPTIKHGQTTTIDLIRIGTFISTVGVATGALAGALESRMVIQNLAIFEDE